MIESFAPCIKAPTDVKGVQIDWTPFAPAGSPAITSHSVAVDVLDLADATFNGALPTGMAAVQATDMGVSGYVQTIKLAAGASNGYSTISATVVFADGTQLTRGFRCLVR